MWKLRTSDDFSPPSVVSVSTACHMTPSGSDCVVFSAEPASVASTCAAGAESSPARDMRVTTNRRLAKLTACPSAKVMFLLILSFQIKEPRKLIPKRIGRRGSFDA